MKYCWQRHCSCEGQPVFFVFAFETAILKRTEEGETTRALEEMARSDGQGVQHQW